VCAILLLLLLLVVVLVRVCVGLSCVRVRRVPRPRACAHLCAWRAHCTGANR